MLRPYQTAAIESALHALTIHGSAVMQMPTGAGKTKAATEIVKRHDKPVWFICHRQEIERQAAAAFAAAGIDFGVVSPRGKPEYDKPVQIVSVATLTRRIKDLPRPSLAIWDECHHVAAKSWAAIREQLNGAQNLGLTATPERLDGKGLSEWFGELVVGPSTRELIDGGYLSDFRYFAPSDPDLSAAKLQAGDYKKGDIAKVMNAPVLIGDAVAEYKRSAAGKRALAFCAGVDASKALVARFNAEGILAAHVDGTTPTDERDAAVAALADGSIKVLSNVEVFTEGFDLPAIDAVILLRPTKSLALFLQMIGRALRLADGKSEALIFDHAGLWLDHGWFDTPIEWSLDGGARQRRIAKMGDGRLRRCPECKEVRVEREPVCSCGYEFPTGREIGEYDGVLRELRGVVPEGCVTIPDFANTHNISRGTIYYLIRRGMPKAGDNYIFPPDAMEWIKSSGANIPPVWLKNSSDFISKKAFARLTGLSEGRVARMVKRGDIRAVNGWVLSAEAKKLSSERVSPYKALSTSEVSKGDFADMHGVGLQTVGDWVRRGIPHNKKNGWILKGAANEWLAYRGLPRLPGDQASGYERIPRFASRILAKQGTVYSWSKKRGMPHDKKMGVHIQRGLEWVRDNTNIEIPPEAWPADNDNQASQPAAAQAA